MTISTLTLSATAGTVDLPQDDATLTLDEGRAPFASAVLTVPLDEDILDAIDPRTDARVSLSLEQRFSGSIPLSDLSDEFAGLDLDDVSTQWAGLQLAALTVRYGHAWNSTGFRRTRRLRADLGVRSRVIDHQADTITVTLASDEALLIDYGLLSTVAVSPAALTVLSAVQLALSYAVPGAVLSTSDGAQTIAADAAAWQPGVSAWDYLSPITASANLRLWCDEARVWHLQAPESIIAPGQATLSATGTVTGARDTISRDEFEWFDGVVVTYDWIDSSNVRQIRQDIAGDATTSRVLHVLQSRPQPRAGEAEARLRKVQGRGRVLSIDAVADPEVYPSQAASLSIPGAPTQTGFVVGVTWSLPADEMTVTSRGLIDTPATSWGAGPVGVSWDDLPVGMSWPELDWEEVA